MGLKTSLRILENLWMLTWFQYCEIVLLTSGIIQLLCTWTGSRWVVSWLIQVPNFELQWRMHRIKRHCHSMSPKFILYLTHTLLQPLTCTHVLRHKLLCWVLSNNPSHTHSHFFIEISFSLTHTIILLHLNIL